MPVADEGLSRVLSGENDTMDRLCSIDPGAWSVLAEALAHGALPAQSPRAFVLGALERGTFDGWLEMFDDALGRIGPEELGSVSALRKSFASWLGRGIVASRPAYDPDALAARLHEIEREPGPAVCDDAAALVRDLEEWAPHDAVYEAAQHVLAARLLEEGRFRDAHAVVSRRRAEPSPEESLLLTMFGGGSSTDVADRLRAAALLGELRLQEGFDLLERIIDAPAGPVLPTKRFIDFDDPRMRARRDLAFHAQGAVRGDPTWLEQLARAADVFRAEPTIAAALRDARARFGGHPTGP